MPTTAAAAFGPLLRRWRGSRRLTQEQLAQQAEVSTRHLSCLEAGKASPSREMVLVLASALDLELRDRNVLLGAAGYAAVYRSSPLEAAGMAPVRHALDLMLRQQEPYGAVVVDRLWNVLRMNDGARRTFTGFLPGLPSDPRVASNVLHAVFSPEGLRPAMVNWESVAAATLERLEREIALHPEDDARQTLRDELLAYPGARKVARTADQLGGMEPFIPVHLRRHDLELKLFSTLTTLGTPIDVTAQELVIESWFPADEASDRWLRERAAQEHILN